MKPAIEAMKFLCAFPVIVAVSFALGLIAMAVILWVIVREAARWAWDLCCLAWVALGEPDARNDAEKDGGGR